MPRLSFENRQFVNEKRNHGYGYRRLQRALHSERGVTVSRRTIQQLCKRIEETGSVADRPRQGTTILNDEQKQYLDQLIQEKPDHTARELVVKIQERYNVTVSRSTISRARTRLGYTAAATKYCQLIRDANKVKRLDWCRRMQETNEQFEVSNFVYCI